MIKYELMEERFEFEFKVAPELSKEDLRELLEGQIFTDPFCRGVYDNLEQAREALGKVAPTTSLVKWGPFELITGTAYYIAENEYEDDEFIQGCIWDYAIEEYRKEN